MELLDKINKSTIIICSLGNKKMILNELNNYNKLFNIKFLTINELYDSFFFTYNEKTIYNLINKYNIKYEVAKVYLDNLIYIDDVESEKINKLKEIKKYLDDNKLLIRDKYFKDYIKDKDIIFYGYNIDKFTNKVIDNLKAITKVYILENNNKTYKHEVLEFNHIEEEVEYVANKICKLLKNNVDINNIKLVNLNEEYYNPIKRIFKIYNLNVDLDDNCTITSTIIGQKFIKYYNNDLNITIELLKQEYSSNILNQIINIINKYTFEENKLKVKDMIIYDLNNTKVQKDKLMNSIKVIDYNDVVNEEYVFMMNFNQGIIPKIIKDEEYLSNKDKKLLELDTSITLYKSIKEFTKKRINSIKNLTITYKLQSYTNNYFPSTLIEEMNLEVKKENIDFTNSVLANKIKLTKYLDEYYKYNIKNKNLNKLYYNYKLPYRTYNNSFKGITLEVFNKLKNNITLSYSSMQLYNECAFKYYLSNILNLEPIEETFSALIGKLFHHILELGINNKIDVDKEINDYLSNKDLNAKEQFFIEKLKPDILLCLNLINNNMKYTKLKNIKTENKFEIVKNGIVFKGFIDKMMTLNDNDKTIVALIDYKTYDTNINLDLIDYGLNIQLPIYLYLVYHNVENATFAGFYVQRVLTNEIKYDPNESLEKQKSNAMKLLGFSTNNMDILNLFDNNYEDSNIIKGMKLKNDGSFANTANILSDNQMKELISKVDNVIEQCIINIKNANFQINPKIYKENNISCKYCKYKDICYKKRQDEIEVGDKNA